MDTLCRTLLIGTLATTLGAHALGAQGAQARRSLDTAPAVEQTRVESARSMLRRLAGTWRFEIRFSGNFDGPPDASGTRVLTPLFDSLSLEWTEELDASPIRGRGLMVFDRSTGQFVSSGVYSGGSGAEFLTGTLARGEPLITFEPAPAASAEPPAQGSTLTLLDADHFTWVALDRGWRALFTRQPIMTGAAPE